MAAAAATSAVDEAAAAVNEAAAAVADAAAGLEQLPRHHHHLRRRSLRPNRHFYPLLPDQFKIKASATRKTMSISAGFS